jgi:hypothetical protein
MHQRTDEGKTTHLRYAPVYWQSPHAADKTYITPVHIHCGGKGLSSPQEASYQSCALRSAVVAKSGARNVSAPHSGHMHRDPGHTRVIQAVRGAREERRDVARAFAERVVCLGTQRSMSEA